MDPTIAHKPGRARPGALTGALALAGLQVALPAIAAAAPPEPIASRNLSPLYANLGLPVLSGAAMPQPGKWQASYRLHWSSHSLRETGLGTALEFDGETQRHDLRLRAGVTDRLAVEANLPFVRHSAGQLDRLIDDWHGFWGLPDGFRDDQPRDRLRFAYTASPGFAFDDAASGPGDIELGLSWRLLESDAAAVALFTQAKIPTGDRERFTGSGDPGYSAGLRVTLPACLLEAMACHAQFGVADVGRIAFAPQADRRTAFASVALAWSLTERLALIGQLDAHGVVYNRGPLDASGPPVWGTLGLSWSFSDGWTLDAAFSEDLAVGSAPDITFLFGLQHRF